MSDTTKPIATLRDYWERTTHWMEGGATRHDAKLALDGLDDAVEWLEKGLAEWRAEAIAAKKQAEAARATARIAITHLQAVLLNSSTHAERQWADTAARLWLQSIGSD